MYASTHPRKANAKANAKANTDSSPCGARRLAIYRTGLNVTSIHVMSPARTITPRMTVYASRWILWNIRGLTYFPPAPDDWSSASSPLDACALVTWDGVTFPGRCGHVSCTRPI